MAYAPIRKTESAGRPVESKEWLAEMEALVDDAHARRLQRYVQSYMQFHGSVSCSASPAHGKYTGSRHTRRLPATGPPDYESLHSTPDHDPTLGICLGDHTIIQRAAVRAKHVETLVLF